MHEMALTNGVLKILAEQAERQDFRRIKTVWLEVGVLSHAEPEAMRFCFDAAARGTVADGAELVILRPEGRAWCMDCADTVPISRRGDPCPSCGGFALAVSGGEELRVKELEVE